jgi:hypothetical protein
MLYQLRRLYMPSVGQEGNMTMNCEQKRTWRRSWPNARYYGAETEENLDKPQSRWPRFEKIQIIWFKMMSNMLLNSFKMHRPKKKGDRKVTQSPIRDACFISQKINYTEFRKKRCYIECWKCPPRSAMHAFTLFLMFERFLSCTLPVSRKRFTRRDIVDLSGTGQ